MSYKRWLLIAAFLFGAGLALGLATPASIVALPSEDIAALKKLADLLAPLPRSSVLAIILLVGSTSISVKA